MSRHTANRVNLPASRYGRSRPNWGSSGSGLADSAPGRLLRSASTFLRDGGKGACAGLARRCRHAVRRPWLRLCRDCRVSLRLCAHPCAALARTELLRRTAPTAPMYHPALPGPPAWGCFTAPPFQTEVAAEALLGMLSTNIFWVRGTAALLTHDTTRQVPRGSRAPGTAESEASPTLGRDARSASGTCWTTPSSRTTPTARCASWCVPPCGARGEPQLTRAQIIAGTLGLYFTDSLYEPEREPAPPKHARAHEGTRLRRPLEPPAAADDDDNELLPLTNASTSLGCVATGCRACDHGRG